MEVIGGYRGRLLVSETDCGGIHRMDFVCKAYVCDRKEIAESIYRFSI